MKNLKWVVVVVAVVVIGTIAFLVWSRPGEPKAAAQAQETHQQEKTDIEGFSNAAQGSYSDIEHSVTPLELAVDLREIAPRAKKALLDSYNRSPRIFQKDEALALMLATVFLEGNNTDAFKELASQWEGKSAWPAAWFVLDGDLLVLQNKKEEAVAHFQSKTYGGSQDVARLGRLALLSQNNAEEFLSLLRQAQASDPSNPSISILIARALEKATRITEAAQELSKVMKQKSGKQVFQAEALAELFRRYGYQPFSISVWDSIGDKLTPETEAQALFWKRVIAAPSPSKLERQVVGNPYVEYLVALPVGEFWNAKNFSEIPTAREILITQQETYWLRLLDALATDDLEAALTLIKSSSFKGTSWNPDLEVALEATLNRRLTGVFTATPTPTPSALELEYGTAIWLKPEEDPFMAEIISSALEGQYPGSQVGILLEGKNAFSAIFLAEGWDKAALALHKVEEDSEDYPAWYLVRLTKAMAVDAGVKAALQFALDQGKSPELDLQIAELYMENGKLEEGLQVLEQLRTENNEVGARAAWITAQHYLRKDKLDVAKQVILANYYLAQTDMGQETLAIITSKQAQEQSK